MLRKSGLTHDQQDALLMRIRALRAESAEIWDDVMAVYLINTRQVRLAEGVLRKIEALLSAIHATPANGADKEAASATHAFGSLKR